MRRIAVLSISAIVLPMALGAQQPAANRITQSFRGMGYFGSWLLTAFDSIPASKYAFKPTPVQQSIGYIAQHLEDANYQLCTRFSGVQRPVTAKDSLADTVKAMWPKDTLVARLKASPLFCRDAMERVNDANLADELPAGPPGSGRTSTRARYLLLFVTDLAEHYSQIASYMRILGMVPPSALPAPTR
ncbi:MAG: DinB family protein [Gemmatimonadaceae bacterium]